MRGEQLVSNESALGGSDVHHVNSQVSSQLSKLPSCCRVVSLLVTLDTTERVSEIVLLVTYLVSTTEIQDTKCRYRHT